MISRVNLFYIFGMTVVLFALIKWPKQAVPADFIYSYNYILWPALNLTIAALFLAFSIESIWTSVLRLLLLSLIVHLLSFVLYVSVSRNEDMIVALLGFLTFMMAPTMFVMLLTGVLGSFLSMIGFTHK